MLGMTTYLRLENKRRDKVEGGRPPKGSHLETFEKFDLAPGESSSSPLPLHQIWSKCPCCGMSADMQVSDMFLRLLAVESSAGSGHSLKLEDRLKQKKVKGIFSSDRVRSTSI